MRSFKQFFIEALEEVEKFVSKKSPQSQLHAEIAKRIYIKKSVRYIKGDVDLRHKLLTRMPLDLTDVKIIGSFRCSGNLFKSLHGVPHHVEHHFHCDHNNLINLEYSPKYVGGDYNCLQNPLESLKGLPEIVKGDFYCDPQYTPPKFKGWILPHIYPTFRQKYVLRDEFGDDIANTIERL